jgi:deoxyribodipyrimidine photo-lyase
MTAKITNMTIWWVRRDLRLADNPALTAAVAEGDVVVPLFILDPSLLQSPYVGDKRLAFLFDGLRALDVDLGKRGSRLIVRRGAPVEALRQLVVETGATAIYAEEDVSPYARQRDARVAAALPLHLTGGLTVHPPDAVLKADGDPYTVYTPYSRTWKSLPKPDARALLPVPERLSTPKELASEVIPDRPSLSETVPFVAGEAAAQQRLEDFVAETIGGYQVGRDRMDLTATSRLSPYLRLGMLSAQRAVVAALDAKAETETDAARRGVATWLNELIWREFYAAILFNFPEVRQHSFRPEYRELAWENAPDDFAAWQEGMTGYPVVDAAMRGLQATGWMHNRARMVVASFLTKDLLIDWRWGERHFMQHLIDGDPAANNGGWQWSAGTGTDAAPYFRIFNPILQSEKYDPDGVMIRRWVPELENVETRYIHQPWTMPEAMQQEAGCVIGVDYPAPIVDHKEARRRTLAAFKQARERYEQQH